MTKYLISHYGAIYAVGLIQAEGAQEDMNLAHNLFNSTCHDSIFHGTILFDTLKQFKKFLAFKEFFAIRKPDTANEYSTWREAFRRAKRVMDEQCRANNFMFQMVAANNKGHNLGNYQDETDYEC